MSTQTFAFADIERAEVDADVRRAAAIAAVAARWHVAMELIVVVQSEMHIIKYHAGIGRMLEGCKDSVIANGTPLQDFCSHKVSYL